MLEQLNIYEVYNIYYKDIANFMIFLANNTVKSFKIPRNWNNPASNLALTMVNRFTNKKYTFYLIDFEDSELCYEIKNIDLSELSNGEYEYILSDNTHDISLSIGLIQIGPREINNLHYNDKEQYIEYGK